MTLPDTNRTLKEAEQLMAAERQEMLQYACYRLGSIDDAEDAVQDVFVMLHRRLGESNDEGIASDSSAVRGVGADFKEPRERGGNAEVRNLSAYLYRTLANICISRLREAGRMPTVAIDSQPEPMVSEDDDFEQEYRRINHLLNALPEEQAEIIRLRYYGNKSFQEIADILGIKLPTAKSRFRYGIEKIKQGMAPFL